MTFKRFNYSIGDQNGADNHALPAGTLVINNAGELRLHDGTMVGGNAVGGGGFASYEEDSTTYNTLGVDVGLSYGSNVWLNSDGGLAMVGGTNSRLVIDDAHNNVYISIGDSNLVNGIPDDGLNWIFGADGSLTLPQSNSGAAMISAGTLGLQFISNSHSLQFTTDGTLVFPDNSVQTTAYSTVYTGFNVADSTPTTALGTLSFQFVSGVVQVAGDGNSVFSWTGQLITNTGSATSFGNSMQIPEINTPLSLNGSNAYSAAGDTVVINLLDSGYGHMYRITAMGSPTGGDHGTMTVEKLM